MKVRLKPAPGRAVRDPLTGDLLPRTGAAVDPSPYWSRRLADGDVLTAARAAKPTKESDA